jgi:hypothetical protein
MLLQINGKVIKEINGKKIIKVVVVPDKIVNIIVEDDD